MTKPRQVVWLLVGLLLAGGCATSSNHGTDSGLKEAQLSRNGFRVTYSGNNHISTEKAEDLCLMRSAEITLEHEFHYFFVMRDNLDLTPATNAPPFSSDLNSGHDIRVSKSFVCFREKPQIQAKYYDATNVLEELRTKYHIDKKGVTRHIAYRPGEATVGILFQTNVYPQQFTIHDFVEGSPAAKSGLEIGDKVISYNGASVTNSERLADEMDNWSIGEPVEVKVERNGKPLSVPIKTIANSWAIHFRLRAGTPKFAPTDPDSIRFLTARPRFRTVIFASKVDWENPFPTLEEFQRYASLEAGRIGADGVLIMTNREQIQLLDPKVNKNAGFVAWAFKIPAATLGVSYEPAALEQKKWIVRKFDPTRPDGGNLKIGDNIISIDGADPLDFWAVTKQELSWRPGQTIKLGVVRDGAEKTIEIETISNN